MQVFKFKIILDWIVAQVVELREPRKELCGETS